MRLAETAVTTDDHVQPVNVTLLGSSETAPLTKWMVRSEGYPDAAPHPEESPTGLYSIPSYFVGTIPRHLFCDQGISTQLKVPDDAPWVELLTGVRTESELSRWGAYVEERLDQIESGLDRDGAPTYPEPATVKQARLFADSMFGPRTPTPSVVPSEEGAISFVWHKGGFDLDIEVSDSEVYVCVYHRASGSSFFGSSRQHLVAALGVLESLSNLP